MIADRVLVTVTGPDRAGITATLTGILSQQGATLHIHALILVERDGQKKIIIGDKGERIKRIGMETRVELEKLADAKVFLELWVKVRSGWADDEARVRSFGYE